MKSKTNKGAYTIRAMTRAELKLAVEWAAAEEWNPGLCDADCFYAADPNGFLMGFLEGEPIASISVVKYGNDFGFLGFYMVRPDFRGRGYGWQIWQAGLDYLKGRTIGLDGVLQQQNNYVKSGFQLAHRNIRYEGTATGSENPPLAPPLAKDSEVRLVSLASVPTETIMEYDSAIFLQARAAFLHCWLASPQHVGIGLMDGHRLAGYGVLRPCQQGYKIGPLFADTPQFAETLFLALKAHVEPGNLFYLDVPEVNKEAVALANKHRMTSMFETARMYRTLSSPISDPTSGPTSGPTSDQSLPELPLERIFGITTFELG